MRRRALLRLLGATAALAPLGAFAQSNGLPVVGFLSIERPDFHPEADAFVDGLQAQGWRDGGNLRLDYRWAGYDADRLVTAAQELVARKVAVIVAFDPAAAVAINATRTIPIVMRSTRDPVRIGRVDSLAHPGGNVTGLSSDSASLYPKRIEILRELLPGARRLGVLYETASSSYDEYRSSIEQAAAAFGFEVIARGVRDRAGFAGALDALGQAGAEALIPLRSPLIVNARALLAELASARRIPVLYDDRAFVQSGGLMSYGPNLQTLHRRAAYFVDRILRGAKPAELPVEEPTLFEFLVNAKAARAIGLAVPEALLARADEVIE